MDEKLSLEDGAVRYWEKQYGRYQTSVLYKAFAHYNLPVPTGIPVRQFSSMEKPFYTKAWKVTLSGGHFQI